MTGDDRDSRVVGRAELAIAVARTDQRVMPWEISFFESIDTVYGSAGWL